MTWPNEATNQRSYRMKNSRILREVDRCNRMIESAKAQIRTMIESREAIEKHLQIKCISSVRGVGCGKWHKVSDVTYIQSHFYVPPSGCTEGDYWSPAEGGFICPSCGTRNRLYNRKWYEELKYRFKNIENEYSK